MAKVPTIEVGSDGQRRVVVLLRAVRASNGQEFLAGWRCGFAPGTAEFLVATGAAKWPEEPAAPAAEPAPSEPAPSGLPPLVVRAVGFVGVPPVSNGGTEPTAEDAEPAEPSQSKPTNTRRRK